MRKQTATWTASEHPASYWLEQAELATAHAKSRPGVDLDGFFAEHDLAAKHGVR